MTPTERLKTILISNATKQIKLYRGELRECEAIIRTQSMRGLYRGLVPTILKQSSTQGVKMGSYNIIREFSRRHGVPQNEAAALITGALAGAVTVYITQPFDTIKTRTQSTQSTGIVQAFRDITRMSGLRGLWTGSTSRVGRLAFSSSILYTVYEKIALRMNGSLEAELFVYSPMATN